MNSVKSRMRGNAHVRFGRRAGKRTDREVDTAPRPDLTSLGRSWTRSAAGSRTRRWDRGRKADPLYRARKLLVLAQERLDDTSQGKLTGLLKAGDPKGEVTTAWHAKEAVRELYSHRDPELALEWVDQLSADMRDRGCPPEVRQLGRTMRRWRTQIAAWHQAQVSNGPTETMNALAKRIKRVAFGMTNFRNWRIRVLLYAGKPDWSKLATVTP